MSGGIIGFAAWRLIATGLSLLIGVAQWSPAVAAKSVELLMFEEQGCPWCRRWHADVGIAYPNTPEGQRLPLRRLDIHGPKPDGISLATPVRATPTFVLIENGREIGRITGYPGADFFWGLLNGLLAKLETGAPSNPPKGDSAAAAALSNGI